MNFIYRKLDVLSTESCQDFIKAFETSDLKQPGVLYGPEGTSSTGGKKSTDITFNPSYLNDPTWGPLLTQVVDILGRGKRDYITRHETAFSKLDDFTLDANINMQRYLPGEGFTAYHCERAGLKYGNRILVWMIYLNTVHDAGETEFFYQQHFEQAWEGKLVIWPSDWTHLHRGIPSPSESKYILTGWFVHQPQE
jgi:hypothetical protein